MKERLNILYQNGQNGLTPAVSASGLLNAVARKWITIEDAVEIIGLISQLRLSGRQRLLKSLRPAMRLLCPALTWSWRMAQCISI